MPYKVLRKQNMSSASGIRQRGDFLMHGAMSLGISGESSGSGSDFY